MQGAAEGEDLVQQGEGDQGDNNEHRGGGSGGCYGRDQEKDCRADNEHHLTDYEEGV